MPSSPPSAEAVVSSLRTHFQRYFEDPEARGAATAATLAIGQSLDDLGQVLASLQREVLTLRARVETLERR